MAKVWTVLTVLAAFLLVAPVIEYGAAVESTHIFTAVGNADGGGGGD